MSHAIRTHHTGALVDGVKAGAVSTQHYLLRVAHTDLEGRRTTGSTVKLP